MPRYVMEDALSLPMSELEIRRIGDWNTAARRAHEALGFEASGATASLAHDPSIF